MERFDSCHSIWVVDQEGHRFCRLPRGSRVDLSALQGEWENFHDFEIHDDGAHVLTLNADRTRLLRFWQHREPCPHCASDQTEELSVQPIED